MTWRNVAIMAASIALTVIAAELVLRQVYSPPLRRMEAADGLRAYRAGDPTTLLIGSSHGRSFERMRAILGERTGGRERLLPFALELGKLSSYRWLIEHKIQPLTDERDASGALVRPSLARFILVTEWWDACIAEGKIEDNVPARAWDLSDYAADVARHGMTPFNRNYTAWKWTSSLYGSVLVADRGGSSTTSTAPSSPAAAGSAAASISASSWCS